MFYFTLAAESAGALQPGDIDFKEMKFCSISKRQLKGKVRIFELKLLRQLVLLDEF